MARTAQLEIDKQSANKRNTQRIEENHTVKLIKRLFAEETGAETVEYALVLALMALAAAAGVSTAGTKLSGWWNTLGSTISGLSSST